MRYVIPNGDTELNISFRGGDSFYVSQSSEGTIYLYIEEIDNEYAALENAKIRVFETGETIEGYYIGTLAEGKNAKHVYWVNYEESSWNDNSRLIRDTDEMPEVSDAGGSDNSVCSSGQGQDV